MSNMKEIVDLLKSEIAYFKKLKTAVGDIHGHIHSLKVPSFILSFLPQIISEEKTLAITRVFHTLVAAIIFHHDSQAHCEGSQGRDNPGLDSPGSGSQDSGSQDSGSQD